jgi:murein L,D-transpeptidase YcbB/YkuD
MRVFGGMVAVLLASIGTDTPANAAPTPPAPRLIPLESAPALVTPPAPPPRVFPSLTASQRAELEAMLATSAANGLSHGDAATAAPARELDDSALIVAALRQAQAVRSGRLDASDFRNDWAMRPVREDPWPAFAEALAQDRLKTWIANLPPPYVGYDGLRRGLAAYRAIEAAGGWPAIAAGPDLTIGAKGERVAVLRKRLRIEDKTLAAGGDTFDHALLDAVRRAQRRYGLNPSGIVAAQTRAALNVPVADRIRQIMANMERWRWLPQTLAPVRVQVNIAAAVLTLFDGDTPIASMRAVTGRPGDETPMLQSEIHSIVINPPWNVPSSIARRELWPKERANPGYLKRNGFKVIALADGGNRLQQAAGPQSALGRLKFDFDNPFAVYLHDTPTQATFQRYDRLASHGCVRLAEPLALANLLLKDDPKWADGGVEAAIAKGDTVRARLPQPVAVYLLYWTAFAGADGQMNFRADPYGWDRLLAARIESRGQLAAR